MEIDAASERGEIDDDAWHRAMAADIVPAYLAGDVRRGSGHAGTADDWEYSRGVVGELVAAELVAAELRAEAPAAGRATTSLDVGCANGLLMESIARWCPAVEPYGALRPDIAPELAARARERLPDWADRIFVGNALGWRPPHRFDVIRTSGSSARRTRSPPTARSSATFGIGASRSRARSSAPRTVERPHRIDLRLRYRALALHP